uniref:Uncharacterized protein n=1 Tax=Rhizophora mucronata TaxID=61149 RepID=A0A2P2PRX3_RHIMU
MNCINWHQWHSACLSPGDKLGLSLELGSFAAGVMISTSDLAQHALKQCKQAMEWNRAEVFSKHNWLCFNCLIISI